MKKTIYVFAGVFFLLAGILNAQKPAVVASDKTGWHKISETVVSFEKETDEVDVMLSDKFAALRFKVTDAPIELRDADIVFEDGTKQNITIGDHLKKAGDTSREIDIKGAGEKSIDRIILRYNTVKNHNNKKGHVEIWGRKTNADKPVKENQRSDKK